MKKKLLFILKDRGMSIFAIAVLVIMLIPLIHLAFYSVPWYDDYNYIRFTKGFYNEYGGIKGIFGGVWYVVKSSWVAWQGTFSSIMMMALNPCYLADELYPVGVIFNILFFTFGAFFFSETIAKYVLKVQKSQKTLISVIVTISLIELIYSAQQGLFWYNASIHYTFMHSCLMILIACIVRMIRKKGKASLINGCILSVVLSIFCGGSNYVTALQGIIILLIIFTLTMIVKNKRGFFILLPLLTYITSFIINVSAPGNRVRAEYFQGYGIVKSIVMSFITAGKYLLTFITPMMLICLLFTIPIFWKIVVQLQFNFSLPVLVTLISICLYATGFTPSLYAMGSEGVERIWVVIKITLQILLYINLFYWMGWIAKRCKIKRIPETFHYLMYYTACIFFAVVVFGFTKDKIHSYSSYGAYYYMQSGEAKNFHNEYLERIALIKQSTDESVEVTSYKYHPSFICVGDLSENPYDETNVSMARWYGKEKISRYTGNKQ